MDLALSICYYSLLLSGCIIGWKNYDRSLRGIRFLIILLGLTIINEGVAYWAALVYRNNWLVYQVYNFFSIGLYAGLFYESIQHPKLRRIILYSGFGIMLFWIVNFIWIEPLFSPSKNIYRIMTMYFFAGACVLLFQQLELPGKVKLFKEPLFLIALSLVWFNTVSSLFFFFIPVFSKHRLGSNLLYDLHFFSALVHYSIFLWAMLNLKNYRNVPVSN
jgi:hypothetical protein